MLSSSSLSEKDKLQINDSLVITKLMALYLQCCEVGLFPRTDISYHSEKWFWYTFVHYLCCKMIEMCHFPFRRYQTARNSTASRAGLGPKRSFSSLPCDTTWRKGKRSRDLILQVTFGWRVNITACCSGVSMLGAWVQGEESVHLCRRWTQLAGYVAGGGGKVHWAAMRLRSA